MPLNPAPQNARFKFVPVASPCLYVVEVDDGRVKVGITKSPQNRLISLRNEVKPALMLRFFVTASFPNDSAQSKAERHLIARMRRMGTWTEGRGSEFFRGVPFHTALLEAECAQQWFAATAAH